MCRRHSNNDAARRRERLWISHRLIQVTVLQHYTNLRSEHFQQPSVATLDTVERLHDHEDADDLGVEHDLCGSATRSQLTFFLVRRSISFT